MENNASYRKRKGNFRTKIFAKNFEILFSETTALKSYYEVWEDNRQSVNALSRDTKYCHFSNKIGTDMKKKLETRLS